MAYTTVALVSSALKGVDINSTTTPSSSEVTEWMNEVDSEIDQIFGKSFTSTTITDEYVDYDGSGYLRLPYAPVISISSLEHLKGGLGTSNITTTSLSEGRTNDFLIYKDEGEIKFYGNNAPTFGYNNIKWSGVVGYSSVPKWVQRLATLMVVRNYIKATVTNTAQKGGRSISVGNLSLGSPSNFSSSEVRDINAEIENIITSKISASHVFRRTRNYRK